LTIETTNEKIVGGFYIYAYEKETTSSQRD
jgi:hypothetical protein